MSADLERRLERLLQADAEPDVEARVRAVALAALPSPAPRGRGVRISSFLRSRRRIGPLIVIGLLLATAGAIAALVVGGGSTTDPRRAVLVTDEAQRRFDATPALADAPWLLGPGGPARIDAVAARPSAFLPGLTSYRAALQRLYAAVSEKGSLPEGARLGPPLPTGVVVRLSAPPAEGVAIDLRAPFGYAVPSGRIAAPAYASLRDATFPRADRFGTPLPTGAVVSVPALRPCQIMRGARRPRPCELAARSAGTMPPTGDVLTVPGLSGRSLPEALKVAVRADLSLAAGGGAIPAYSDGAIARAVAARRPPFGPSPIGRPPTRPDELPSIDDLRREGLRALIPAGGSGQLSAPAYAVRLAHGEEPPPGTVIGQFPPEGTRVAAGTPVVVAAVADDCLDADAHGSPDCVPGAMASRRRLPAIAPPLPWLDPAPDGASRRITEAEPRPGLRFPPGTTYLDALRSIYVSVVVHGTLPPEARVTAPLPPGVVVRRGARPTVSLSAPFGYDRATGIVNRPTLEPTASLGPAALRRAVSAGRAALLPPGADDQYLTRPALAACQVAPPEGRTHGCENEEDARP